MTIGRLLKGFNFVPGLCFEKIKIKLVDGWGAVAVVGTRLAAPRILTLLALSRRFRGHRLSRLQLRARTHYLEIVGHTFRDT